MAGVYIQFSQIQTSKIQTFSPNSSKKSLKWSKKVLQMIPDFYTHFLKLKHWGSKFCVLGKKWCSKKFWMGIMNILKLSTDQKILKTAWINPKMTISEVHRLWFSKSRYRVIFYPLLGASFSTNNKHLGSPP